MHTLTVAWRSLRRAPAFTIAAVLTLAIGVGATTAIFTVLNSVFLKPLPYREPDRLAGVWFALPGMNFNAVPQSASSYFTFRRRARSIEGIAIFDRSSVNVEASSDARPERVRAALVTASLFPLLGVSFERGRGFTEAEDTPRGDPVVVIGDGLWHRRFGGDPNVIGKKIQIDGRQHDIIGVAPADFQFPDATTQLWVPIALDSATSFGGAFGHQGFARLEPGVTIGAAQRELNALLPAISELYPNIAPGMATDAFLQKTHASIVVHTMRADVVGSFGNVVWIAAAAGMLLLIISCANVASLLLTRAESRQRELAVRVALGAGPVGVMTQFLTESFVLASLGGAAGMLLAVAGVRAFVRAGPPGIPRLAEVGVDYRVILFALVVVLVITLVCSALPALHYDSRSLGTRLRDGTRGGTTGRDRQRARRTLVVTQIAFATVLVGGAGVLFQSFERLRQVRTGFDAQHALVLWLSLPNAQYANDSAVVRFTSQLLLRAAAVPGVQAVGVSSKVPLSPIGTNYTPIWSDADRDGNAALPPSAEIITATGGYFAAMGIPLLAGRTFDAIDRQAPQATIIDRALAQRYWGDSTGRAAIGRRLRFTTKDWYTVVGVVGVVRDTSLAGDAAGGQMYLPDVIPADTNLSSVTRTLAVTIHTAGDPRALTTSLERAIADVDRSLPAFGVAAMGDVVEQSMARLSFVMTLVAVTAVVSLLLAAIGLYGVLAYMVSLRSREISVRLALGALPLGVAQLVSRQGAWLAVTGTGVGLVILLLASRFLRSLVAGVDRPGPLTLCAVSAFLIATAFLASWIPARRAARMDPARALAGD